MSSHPPRWSAEQLSQEADISSENFRVARLSPTQAWSGHYVEARRKFDALFHLLHDLDPVHVTNANLAQSYRDNLGEALRYLAGPPISEDDLKVLAGVSSLAPSVLSSDLHALGKVFAVIEQVIDPFRFPWVVAHRAPMQQEREAALLASSVLLAAQRIATERRSSGKNDQESMVKDYLRTLGFSEVPTTTITTIVKGPQANQFCAECLLGDRKADVVLRLHDTRLMALECKVSNSSTNSVKRVNNDAAVKATYWNREFGLSQVVPSAMLSGVFKTLNLIQAQKNGLTIFWAHDLGRLGQFIESSR